MIYAHTHTLLLKRSECEKIQLSFEIRERQGEIMYIHKYDENFLFF
uniref:Uncharacterized protein n=1 Tax=Lepeophtheirus salmonis TaxID=72036 RepID=A0A0K2V9R9_LEPSM